jgi:hypothetical protein
MHDIAAESILLTVLINSNNIFKMVDFQRQRKPKLFWVSAMAPMVVVVLGCLLAYFTRDSKYSIQTVN